MLKKSSFSISDSKYMKSVKLITDKMIFVDYYNFYIYYINGTLYKKVQYTKINEINDIYIHSYFGIGFITIYAVANKVIIVFYNIEGEKQKEYEIENVYMNIIKCVYYLLLIVYIFI